VEVGSIGMKGIEVSEGWAKEERGHPLGHWMLGHGVTWS